MPGGGGSADADKCAVNTQAGFGEALGGVLLCAGKADTHGV